MAIAKNNGLIKLNYLRTFRSLTRKTTVFSTAEALSISSAISPEAGLFTSMPWL